MVVVVPNLEKSCPDAEAGKKRIVHDQKRGLTKCSSRPLSHRFALITAVAQRRLNMALERRSPVPKLVIFPGMDGSGELLAEFAKELRGSAQLSLGAGCRQYRDASAVHRHLRPN